MQSSTRHMTLYMRPGCHLCDDAAELLERLVGQAQITEINILEDVELFERYRFRIPVIVVADGPTLFAPISEADLIRALRD